MLYQTVFSRDLFSELDRLQRDLLDAFEGPSIRGGRTGFPALNIGSTPHAVELYALVPGLDPASVEVNLEKGVLTISGERQDDLSSGEEKATVHVHERFAGRFRRVVSLPDDIDPDGVSAAYRDGVLHITAKRRESVQPRRIAVQ
ncbi:MAG: heat-shock protein Hsp20 [Paucimonas sp.]|nr:heat-shock protein Hsp20 [Paucimonas sp.]